MKCDPESLARVRFLFPKSEAVRLTVVAMVTGIVQIAFNEVQLLTQPHSTGWDSSSSGF